MKIRTGFVSNSSSSSFLCIISQEAVKAILETFMDERIRNFLSVFATEKTTKFGKEILIISLEKQSGMLCPDPYDCFGVSDTDIDTDTDEVYKWVSEYQKKLKDYCNKNPHDSFIEQPTTG